MYEFYIFPLTGEDGSTQWGASYPDFPGVVGGGDTPEEAVKEAQENLAVTVEYYKDEGLPLPTPYKETKYDVLVVDKDLRTSITEYAKDRGLSLNQLLSDALNQYISTH
ncbi:MAG: type II toxin-antitoxin system HicB family antitoxin [Firmicutes bacterium]|nr:type II toxin-antitoxin system HicB family antitoxin [Bacillota bacterium]